MICSSHAASRWKVLEEALEEHADEPVTDEEGVDHEHPPSRNPE
jgi:hypothetical protein